MKKLVIFFLGIYLIGLGSALIEWVPELSAPTNLNCTYVSGGSVPIGNYTIVVVGADTDRYTCTPSTGNAPCRRGNVSEEFSLNLTSAGTINCTWDAVSGASHYNLYATTSTSDSKWHGKRVKRIIDDDTQYATTSTNSALVTSSTTLNGNIFDTFAIQTTHQIEGNLDRNLGFGYINLSGIVNDITLTSLASVVPSNMIYWDGSTFIIKGGVHIDEGTTGMLTITNKKITFIQNSLDQDSDDFNVYINDSVINVDAWSDRYGRFAKNTIVSNSFITMNSPSSVNTAKAGDLRFTFTSAGLVDGGNNVLNNNVFLYVWTSSSSDVVSVQDTKVINGLFYATGNGNITSLRMDFPDTRYVLTEASILGKYVLKDSKIGNKLNYNIRFRNAMNFPARCINCDFISYGGSVITNNLRPKIYWSDSASLDCNFTLEFTNNLVVYNSSNIPVEGANVTLKDKDDNLIYSVLTNENGSIEEQTVLNTIVKNSGGIGYDSQYLEFSPFTLTITLENNQPYTQIISNFTEAFNSHVTILPYPIVINGDLVVRPTQGDDLVIIPMAVGLGIFGFLLYNVYRRKDDGGIINFPLLNEYKFINKSCI